MSARNGTAAVTALIAGAKMGVVAPPSTRRRRAPRDKAAILAALQPSASEGTVTTMHRGLLTQHEAADFLSVSVSYLRTADVKKILLPGRGKKRPVLRYDLNDLAEWVRHWRTP
jgi:hypothetical protein